MKFWSETATPLDFGHELLPDDLLPEAQLESEPGPPPPPVKPAPDVEDVEDLMFVDDDIEVDGDQPPSR